MQFFNNKIGIYTSNNRYNYPLFSIRIFDNRYSVEKEKRYAISPPDLYGDVSETVASQGGEFPPVSPPSFAAMQEDIREHGAAEYMNVLPESDFVGIDLIASFFYLGILTSLVIVGIIAIAVALSFFLPYHDQSDRKPEIDIRKADVSLHVNVETFACKRRNISV